jgi:hypothetical protein
MSFASRLKRTSGAPEATLNNFMQIHGDALDGCYPFQLFFHHGPSVPDESSPLAKGPGKGSGDLRVELIEFYDMLRHEIITPTIPGVETVEVPAGKGMQKRPDAIGVAQIEIPV